MATAKIAKPNGTIDDAIKDLVFTSDSNYMIFLSERTDTSNGSGILEFNHNLGYIPAFYPFEEISSGVWQPPFNNCWATDTIIHIETINNNANVRTILFGNSQSNATGIGNSNVSGRFKVAKPGSDATTSTDLRKFKFVSGEGTFKISEQTTVNVSVTSANGTFTATHAHGLGYVPQVYCLLFQTTGVSLPFFDFQGAGISAEFSYSVDSTNLTCKVQNNGGAVSSPSTVTFKAHILYDKIN